MSFILNFSESNIPTRQSKVKANTIMSCRSNSMRSTAKVEDSAIGADTVDLERKVKFLEKSLTMLRTEMERKMGIMEQILTSRNG